MRDFVRFWGRCVVWAFAGWERGQSLSDLCAALVRALLAPALWLASYLPARYQVGGVTDAGPLLAWLSVAYLVVLLLGVAPYKVWKQERQRADAAEARLQVRLSTHAVVRKEDDGKVLSIVVENDGSGHVANCVGELKGVYLWMDGKRERVTDVYPLHLRWSSRYQPEQSPKLTFNTTAELEVVRVPSEFYGHLEVRSFKQRRLPDQYPSGIVWLPERTRYVLDVEISAENCASVRREYLLTLHPLGLRVVYGPGDAVRARPLPDVVFEIHDEAAQEQTGRRDVRLADLSRDNA